MKFVKKKMKIKKVKKLIIFQDGVNSYGWTKISAVDLYLFKRSYNIPTPTSSMINTCTDTSLFRSVRSLQVIFLHTWIPRIWTTVFIALGHLSYTPKSHSWRSKGVCRGWDAVSRTTTWVRKAETLRWAGSMPTTLVLKSTQKSLTLSFGWEPMTLDPPFWLIRIWIWTQGMDCLFVSKTGFLTTPTTCWVTRSSRSGALTCLSCLRYCYNCLNSIMHASIKSNRSLIEGVMGTWYVVL